jgi:hypothetical protein
MTPAESSTGPPGEADHRRRLISTIRGDGEVVDLSRRHESRVIDGSTGVQPPVVTPRVNRSFDALDRRCWAKAVGGGAGMEGISNGVHR